jgi:uncharacterized protein YnzC (UPF0291/DUF896 family)
MAKYRLDTMLESDTLDRLIELAKKEKRSKSATASMLIEEALVRRFYLNQSDEQAKG